MYIPVNALVAIVLQSNVHILLMNPCNCDLSKAYKCTLEKVAAVSFGSWGGILSLLLEPLLPSPPLLGSSPSLSSLPDGGLVGSL